MKLWVENINENYNKTPIILNRSCKSPAVYFAALNSEKIVFLDHRFHSEINCAAIVWNLNWSRKQTSQVTRLQFNCFRWCCWCESEIVEALWHFWHGWRQHTREVAIRSSPKHRDSRKQRNNFPAEILNGELVKSGLKKRFILFTKI